MEIPGKFVPKDARLVLEVSGPYNDHTVYANAEELGPDRWLQHLKPLSLLSFGAPGSPHYCIGAGFAKMMMKVAFATLLREYDFKLDPKQSRKYRRFPDRAPQFGVLLNNFQRRN